MLTLPASVLAGDAVLPFMAGAIANIQGMLQALISMMVLLPRALDHDTVGTPRKGKMEYYPVSTKY